MPATRMLERRPAARSSRTGRSCIELFAGIGLMRLGLEQAGFAVAFANDAAPEKLAMYADNFPADDFFLGDVRAVTGEQLPEAELLTASFPCTDLSVAGAMKGLAGEQSGLFWQVTRLLGELAERRPPVVLLENVPGFLRSRGGEDFLDAVRALGELGYSCDAVLLDAARFTPQSRLRLFLIASLAEPRPTFGLAPSSLRSESLVALIHRGGDCRWNVRRPPEPPPLGAASLESILEDLPDDDPHWWNRERADYLLSQLSERHAAVVDRMAAGDAYAYATAFRRIRRGKSTAEVRTDGLAGCLRTPRGGSARQILVRAGRGRRDVRLLTARECARLQGVPDDYQINVSQSRALFGFGDAVCVPAVAWLANNLLAPLLEELAPSKETR